MKFGSNFNTISETLYFFENRFRVFLSKAVEVLPALPVLPHPIEEVMPPSDQRVLTYMRPPEVKLNL